MKRLFLLAFVAILGLGLTYLMGCNSRATDSDTNADTTDPGFQMVQSVANEGLVGYEAAYLNTALSLI
ncbi:MAG: hypothetical protein NTV06_05725, partial [candidate division Zixibacteria bacterium]|nr:hypothetical protein [candidate division Zixibacteria bacterium]